MPYDRVEQRVDGVFRKQLTQQRNLEFNSLTLVSGVIKLASAINAKQNGGKSGRHKSLCSVDRLLLKPDFHPETWITVQHSPKQVVTTATMIFPMKQMTVLFIGHQSYD